MVTDSPPSGGSEGSSPLAWPRPVAPLCIKVAASDSEVNPLFEIGTRRAHVHRANMLRTYFIRLAYLLSKSIYSVRLPYFCSVREDATE